MSTHTEVLVLFIISAIFFLIASVGRGGRIDALRLHVASAGGLFLVLAFAWSTYQAGR